MLHIDHEAAATIRSFVLKVVVVRNLVCGFNEGNADRHNCGISHDLPGSHTHLAAIAFLHNIISHESLLGDKLESRIAALILSPLRFIPRPCYYILSTAYYRNMREKRRSYEYEGGNYMPVVGFIVDI